MHASDCESICVFEHLRDLARLRLHVLQELAPQAPRAGVMTLVRSGKRSWPVTMTWLCGMLLMGSMVSGSLAVAAEAQQYDEQVLPVLQEFCFGCHSDGEAEGGFSFDQLSAHDLNEEQKRHWWKVLRKLRAGTMPPVDEPAPSPDQKAAIDRWIKSGAFEMDGAKLYPGSVTLRRLNRVEYANTIKDLLGIDFNAKESFPPDDTGHGFDNIGDVLTISPMLLEKYLDAAKEVVQLAVPQVPGVPKKRSFSGSFLETGEEKWRSARLRYQDAAKLEREIQVDEPGDYVVQLQYTATQTYVEGKFDYNKCRVIFKLDEEVLHEQELFCQNWVNHEFKFKRPLKSGAYKLSFELIPLTPEQEDVRKAMLEVRAVALLGPEDSSKYVLPDGYQRFFPRGNAPTDPTEKRQYATEIIQQFASRAFRRPVDADTVTKLADLIEHQYTTGGKTFEAAVSDGMTAVLASPRFLFREEGFVPGEQSNVALIDEFALASRLSYFLWSSMPDEELIKLASENKLRENLGAQVDRMLAHERSKNFFRNFVGQWLQARDIEDVVVNAYAIIERERVRTERENQLRGRFWQLRGKPRDQLTEEERNDLNEAKRLQEEFESLVKRSEPDGEVRRAMRQETEMLFEYLVRENQPLHELLDSNYAFLNQELAEFYGIDGLQDLPKRELKKVNLPEGSPRGGVLTQGTFLAITSNPDRTSPVKRGKFILENLLGTPTAAPPPDVPPLEEEQSGARSRKLTLRESLEIHRENAVCASCHNSMDPLGLALENFNAVGLYREQESTGPIDPSGKLISGEAFATVKELKQILASNYRRELYTCVTEKMLTYALGRGMDYIDVATVDQIVDQLEANEGRAGAIIKAVIQSTPFQYTTVSNSSVEATVQAPTSIQPASS